MNNIIDHLSNITAVPNHDFSQFGEVEVVPLTKNQRLTGAMLSRNWIVIPHVTHHDEVDVTLAEERRAAWNANHPDRKLTPVILLVHALARVLADFPIFNASLSTDGRTMTLKKYVSVGVAVDTSKGLVVPVLRGADTRRIDELAIELQQLAEKARTKGLSMAEMSGASMTISSLGHIGGTAFTPIINLPEVAILGATAIQNRPVPTEDGGVAWRKMLPLSLSYDHRVINGTDAARFVRALGVALAHDTLFGRAIQPLAK